MSICINVLAKPIRLISSEPNMRSWTNRWRTVELVQPISTALPVKWALFSNPSTSGLALWVSHRTPDVIYMGLPNRVRIVWTMATNRKSIWSAPQPHLQANSLKRKFSVSCFSTLIIYGNSWTPNRQQMSKGFVQKGGKMELWKNRLRLIRNLR